MPLQEHHQIISVDDHLIEHPRVWQDRLPEKYPRVRPTDRGGRRQPSVGPMTIKSSRRWG